jgi:hypothetical protein
MNLDADWPEASGTVWLIYVRKRDRRGIFPEGHVVSCQQDKPEGDPNFGGGILGCVEVAVDPGTWGRVVRGEMRVMGGQIVAQEEPRRAAQWQSQQAMIAEGV